MSTALAHLFIKALTPKWVFALSARVHLPYLGQILTDTEEAFEALRAHMVELVSLSRAWVVGGKVSNMDAGLLRNLVEANMTQADDVHHKRLTDDELLSNIFVRLVCFTLANFGQIVSVDVSSGWTWSVANKPWIQRI